MKKLKIILLAIICIIFTTIILTACSNQEYLEAVRLDVPIDFIQTSTTGRDRETNNEFRILTIGLNENIYFEVEITLFYNDFILRIMRLQQSRENKNFARYSHSLTNYTPSYIHTRPYVYNIHFSLNEYPNLTRIEVTHFWQIIYIKPN